MLVEFKLDMPNRGSWNGRWSGEEDYYGVIQNFRKKDDIEVAKRIIEQEYYDYNFGDGWCASIEVLNIIER